MSFLRNLVTEPPPSHVFELSEAGVAFSRHGHTGFQPFDPGTLVPSPLQDNILRADRISAALQQIAPPNGAKKRRPAAVVLPDFSAKISLLDFDSFPSSAEEQAALVRFRVKKAVPFDIDSATVRYVAQPAHDGSKKTDVVAVIVNLEILARYEALFRNANFHPGNVTISGLAALNLYRDPGVAVVAKLSGPILTLMVVVDQRLKLFRCLEVDPESDEDILGVLHPTFAYVEDELGRTVQKLVVCGFSRMPDGLRMEVAPLRSRAGNPGPFNAGLLGCLEA